AEIEDQQQRQRAKGSKVVGEDTPALPNLDPQQASAEEASQPQEEEAVGEQDNDARRIFSVFARGWQVLRNALAAGLLLLGSWHPEAWPGQPMGVPGTPHSYSTKAEQTATDSSANSSSVSGMHAENSG